MRYCKHCKHSLASDDRCHSIGCGCHCEPEREAERPGSISTHALAELLLARPDSPLIELPEGTCRVLLELGFDMGYAQCGVENCGQDFSAGESNPFRAATHKRTVFLKGGRWFGRFLDDDRKWVEMALEVETQEQAEAKLAAFTRSRRAQ